MQRVNDTIEQYGRKPIVTHQEVEDTETQDIKGETHVPMVVEPVQHTDTEAGKQMRVIMNMLLGYPVKYQLPGLVVNYGISNNFVGDTMVYH